MATPLLNLDQLKNLYIQGMTYALNNFSSYYYPKHSDLCKKQIEWAGKSSSLTELLKVVSIPNPVFVQAFNDPKPICKGCALSKTGIQYGEGNIGWYFLYGVTDNYVFNISMFRYELAPPQVVPFSGTQRSEAVRWFIFGGYGKIGGEFYEISPSACYLRYTEPSYSTFTLDGGSELGVKPQISCSFGSNIPFQFYFSIQYETGLNVKRDFNVIMRCNTSPTANFPNSCLCGPGAGTFYYSYTDVDISLTVNEDGKAISESGKGWIDHQTLKACPPRSLLLQSLQVVSQVFRPKYTSGWLWTTVIDKESGLQYMFTYYLPNVYSKSVKKGTTFIPQMRNVYKEGVVYFNPTEAGMNSKDVRITVLDTFTIPGEPPFNIPSKYRVVLPGGKVIVMTVATTQSYNIYPLPPHPIENPALVMDEKESRVIGVGMIEANLWLSNSQLAHAYLTHVNQAEKTNVKLLTNAIFNNPSGGYKFLAFLFVLIPVWLIVIVCVITFYRKDYRRNRFIVSVIVIVLVLLILLGLK